MTPETPGERARRKFVFGVLEQASNILGAMAASILVVGLVLPSIAAFTGQVALPKAELTQVARLVLGFALFAALAAAILRGLARRIDDDAMPMLGVRRRRHRDGSDDMLPGDG